MKQVIEDTANYTYFVDYFECYPIRFYYDKRKDELHINTDDVFNPLNSETKGIEYNESHEDRNFGNE